VVNNSLRLRSFGPVGSVDAAATVKPAARAGSWGRQWAPMLVGVGMVALVLFALSLGTLRAARQIPTAQTRFTEMKWTGDGQFMVVLTVTPDRAGPNVFTVS